MDKSYARRLKLNSAIVKNLYWVLPVDDVNHENYVPVGRGVESSLLCGKFMGVDVCKDVKAHNELSLDGVDTTGKCVARLRHMWCKRSLCPICFLRGWSVRGARSIERRLEEGVKRGFGKVEHISASVHPSDYGLDEKVFRRKVRLALLIRGVVGGCMIFHGYTVDRKRRVLVWKPHYHCLGFILGGFDRCRRCVHVREDCSDCSGFKGREVREYRKDGIIVKVLAEREKSYYDGKPNIFGTAYYQLHHATVRIGISRFHSVTWFGVCGNRKYGTPKVVSKVTCPLCSGDMVRSVFVGSRRIVKDVGDPNYVAVFLASEFDEDGAPNFIDKG